LGSAAKTPRKSLSPKGTQSLENGTLSSPNWLFSSTEANILENKRGGIMGEVDYRFAVLIDADNASYKDVNDVLDQVRILGNICIKRVYGDFTAPQLSPWRDSVNSLSLTPVQQFAYTTGKNATDSKMVIDAMDILYGGVVNAFCIMSSDSDFTGLAKRFKESGMFVFGAGRSSTPPSFVKSCDRFWKVDGERPNPLEKPKTVTTLVKAKAEEAKIPSPLADERSNVDEKEVVDYARDVINAREEQSIRLSKLMEIIYGKFPSFSPKDYGCGKSTAFFSKHDCFKVSGEMGSVLISLNQQPSPESKSPIAETSKG
jgi:hypothetical protein